MKVTWQPIRGGTCTLHGPYAGLHCPTCVTVLAPPATATPPRFSAFVRIRPGGVVEEELRSDPGELDAELEELVALARAPLALDDI